MTPLTDRLPELPSPEGIDVSPDGRMIYVTDSRNHCILVFTPAGSFLGKFGSYGSNDGCFDTPAGVGISPDGIVYVADTGNSRIQRFSRRGEFWDMWGPPAWRFSGPCGITVAADGTVWVSDHHRILHFSATGRKLNEWSTEFGASFFGIAIAPDGTIHVADAGENCIRRFSPTGTLLGKWGMWGSDDGQFSSPWDVAVASNGTVYVVEADNSRIQYFSPTGTFLGKWGTLGYSWDGQFNHPKGIAVAPDGTVYVADTNNQRIQRFSSKGNFLSEWRLIDLLPYTDVS